MVTQLKRFLSYILATVLVVPFSLFMNFGATAHVLAANDEHISTVAATPVAQTTATLKGTNGDTVAETPTITPEPTTLEPTPAPTVATATAPIVTLEPTTTQSPSQWTFEKVELNREYIAPQNSGVKLTFTKLPDPSGNIKIEEITLTQEQIKQTGSLSDKGYDITSDMTDGSFSYNLSLPIPESAKGKAVEVKFAEELSNIASAAKAENTLTKTDTSVSVTSLDHFTIFVVVSPAQTGVVGECTVEVTGATSSDICFNSIQAAINAATAGDVIQISGTHGSASAYTKFDIPDTKTGITLQGMAGNLVYGTFVVHADGVTINGLNIQYKGDDLSGEGFNRGGIYARVNSITITGNTITNGLGTSAGIANGMQIMRLSSTINTNAADYTITGNTISGTQAVYPGYSSAGILVPQNASSGTAGGAYYSILVNDNQIATQNTFNITTPDVIDYVHQDWATGGDWSYSRVSNSAGLSEAVLNSAADATILVATGDYTQNLTIDKSLSLIGAGDTTLINGNINATGDNVTIQNLKITNSNVPGYGVKATAGKALTLENVTVDVAHDGVAMYDVSGTATTININNSRIRGYAAIYLFDPAYSTGDTNADVNINVNDTSLTGIANDDGSGSNDFAVIGTDFVDDVHVSFTGASIVANEYTAGAQAKEFLVWFYNAGNNSVTGSPTYTNGANSKVNENALFVSSLNYTNTVAGQAVARYVSDTTEFEAALASAATTPIVVGRGDAAITTTVDNTLNTGVTLLIESNNAPTTIASGTTLVNNGTIIIETDATFINNGTISGTGTISGAVGGTGTDSLAPAAFTVSTVTPTGGTVVPGYWNGTNTEVDVNVPIANDSSLTGGTVQLQANVGGGFVNVGSFTTITAGLLNTTNLLFALTALGLEGIPGFSDGDSIQFRAVITDNVGNFTIGAQSATALTVDQTTPTGTIVIGDGAAYTKSTSVTLNFSGVSSDVTEMNIANASSYSGWEAYSPTKGWTLVGTDGTKTVRVKFRDAAGNETGTGIPDTIILDTIAPTYSVASVLPTSGSTVKVGDSVVVTITAGGLETGLEEDAPSTVNGVSSLFAEVGGGVYTVTYTAVEGNTDILDSADIPVSITLRDIASNAGTQITTIASGVAPGIDANSPTATIVVADTALKAGETSLVTITFNEAVTDFANADLTIVNGTLTPVSSGDGGVTFTATLTPTADFEDSLNVITIDKTGVTDIAGTAGVGGTDSNNYAIDTHAPTVTVTDDKAGVANIAGGTITYTFTFSEAVTGFTVGEVDVVGGTKAGTFASGSDGSSVYTLVVTPDPNSTTSITVDVAGGVAIDAAENGNTAATQSVQEVDTLAPTTPTATPAAGDYTSDQLVTLASSDLGSGLAGIYYTLDGTTPDNSKALYAEAITVDHDMTIKAIAYDNIGNVSGVLEAVYGIAPVISGETSSSVSETSATITWTTDDLATSRVIYENSSHSSLGLAPNYGYASSTTEDTNKVTSHSVTITGLTAGTTYYYRTVSHGSPETVGAEKSFSTSAAPAATSTSAPTITSTATSTNEVVVATVPVVSTSPSAAESAVPTTNATPSATATATVSETATAEVKGEQTESNKKNNNWLWIIIAILIVAGAAGGWIYYKKNK